MPEEEIKGVTLSFEEVDDIIKAAKYAMVLLARDDARDIAGILRLAFLISRMERLKDLTSRGF